MNKLEKSLYLNFKKVYLQLKILLEKSKTLDSTGLEELNQIADQEIELEKIMKEIEEKML